jgi:hypothetical protein
MNCRDVRASLPALVYGDLGPGEVVQAEEHLAGCPACRRELEGLHTVRRLLDGTSTPPVAVDVGAVYRQSAERQARSARRWRRIACAAGVCLAVVTALAVGFRLEVRVEGHQAILRWGAPPELPATPPAPAPVPSPRPTAPDAAEEQLHLLGELVQALSADVRGRDERLRQEIEVLRRQLREVHLQSVRRYEDADRDLTALYQAQFPARKGIDP